MKRYKKGRNLIESYLGGLYKVKTTDTHKKTYILGVQVKGKKLKKEDVRLENHIYNIWYSKGFDEDLLNYLNLYFKTPFTVNKLTQQDWMVYIACLVEKGDNEKALETLKKYIYLYGLDEIHRFLIPAHFAYEQGIKNNEIERSHFIYENLKASSSNENFVNYLQNKSIALVGNSGCELGKKKGEEIDSHDIVVRFNNYPTDKKYLVDYGTKTNIWVRNSSVDLIPKPDISEFDYAVWKSDLTHMILRDRYLVALANYFKNFPEKFITIDSKYFKSLEEKSWIWQPTSGCMFFWYLYKILGNLDNVDAYGFSFLTKDYNDTTHYFDNLCKIYNHDMALEIDFLDKLYNKKEKL